MADAIEVAFTTAANDQLNAANVWDVRTGTNLMSYKGAVCGMNGLCLLGSDYVISTDKGKPFLRVWPINSHQPLNLPRLLCSWRISAVAASPDKCHIAVAVEEKVQVYQVASGLLLGTGTRHFQPITVVRWGQGGDIIACGGQDGIVTVWSLAALACDTSKAEPKYTFSDHSLPVSDIVITAGVNRVRLISVSADRMCKIYDLSTGNILISLVFDVMLRSVSINPMESKVFVGSVNGSIFEYSLLSPPRSLEYHLTGEETASAFVGHTKAITCLSNSIDGELLMSGSADETVKIWHIVSRQCLRTIPHKGHVTNAFFTLMPKHMLSHDYKPSVILCSFQKNDTSELYEHSVEIFMPHDIMIEDYDRNIDDAPINELANVVENGDKNNAENLNNEIKMLKTVNAELYKLAVKEIFNRDKYDTEEDVKPKLPHVTFKPKTTVKEVRFSIHNKGKKNKKKIKKHRN